MDKRLKQRAYDRVKDHLLTQNAKSLEGEAGDYPRCAYRGDKGMRCAIGALIDDEHYDPSIEKKSVRNPAVMSALAKSLGVDVDDIDLEFFAHMQGTHDGVNVVEWKDSLEYFARKTGLRP